MILILSRLQCREYHSSVVDRERQKKKITVETSQSGLDSWEDNHDNTNDDDLAMFQTEQSVASKKKGITYILL